MTLSHNAYRGFAAALFLVLSAGPVSAQQSGEPAPINAPAIPPLPKLGPAPKLTQGAPGAAPRAQIDVPATASLSTVVPPKQHEMTQADKADTAPPIADITPPAVSPGASVATIDRLTFTMEAGDARLPASAQPKLDAAVTALNADKDARVEIRAYTPQTEQTESKARRLSLARLLSVRDELKKRGVADNRIDSRALGSQPSETDADRIELYVERTH